MSGSKVEPRDDGPVIMEVEIIASSNLGGSVGPALVTGAHD